MAIPAAAFLVRVLKVPSSGGALHGLLLSAVALVGSVCVYAYHHWRCPKCGAYLARSPLYTGQCPSRGTALWEPRG